MRPPTSTMREQPMNKMRRDVFVYISGPMTAKHGFTVEENVAAGLRVYLDCLKRGIPAFSPHLGGAFPTAWTEVSWETWLAYDLAVIDRCTHVLMMPRWETSAGAIKEKAQAQGHDLRWRLACDVQMDSHRDGACHVDDRDVILEVLLSEMLFR